MITHSEIPAVIKDIENRLIAKGRERKIILKVEDQDYHLEDDWLYVTVAPDQKGIRPYDYAELLGEVEKELRSEGIDNVLLVPVIPD